jgi:hypothetical protein
MFGFFKKSRSEWKPYISQKEKFTASFPGEVTRQFLGSFDDDGESPATVAHVSISSKGVIYHVSVTRVSDYFGTPEEFLATAAKEMAKSITECAISSQRNEAFQGYPALVFEGTIRGIMSYSGIIALRDNTLYVISGSFPVGTAGAPDELSRFIAEFQITG